MHHTHAEATPQPLSALPAGQRAIVYSLQGGHEFCSRVANLGFTMGAEVVIRQNYGHGPVLVALRGTLVALGRREASHVLVLAAAPNGQEPMDEIVRRTEARGSGGAARLAPGQAWLP